MQRSVRRLYRRQLGSQSALPVRSAPTIAIGSALGGMGRYWCSGAIARLIGQTFPGEPDHQRPRIFHHQFLWDPHGSGWAHIRRHDRASIRDGGNLRRMHHVFIVQPSNVEPYERRRMLSGWRQHWALGCSVPGRRLGRARTWHCPAPRGSPDQLVFPQLLVGVAPIDLANGAVGRSRGERGIGLKRIELLGDLAGILDLGSNKLARSFK
jgi:hypothetical protein